MKFITYIFILSISLGLCATMRLPSDQLKSSASSSSSFNNENTYIYPSLALSTALNEKSFQSTKHLSNKPLTGKLENNNNNISDYKTSNKLKTLTEAQPVTIITTAAPSITSTKSTKISKISTIEEVKEVEDLLDQSKVDKLLGNLNDNITSDSIFNEQTLPDKLHYHHNSDHHDIFERQDLNETVSKIGDKCNSTTQLPSSHVTVSITTTPTISISSSDRISSISNNNNNNNNSNSNSNSKNNNNYYYNNNNNGKNNNNDNNNSISNRSNSNISYSSINNNNSSSISPSSSSPSSISFGTESSSDSSTTEKFMGKEASNKFRNTLESREEIDDDEILVKNENDLSSISSSVLLSESSLLSSNYPSLLVSSTSLSSTSSPLLQSTSSSISAALSPSLLPLSSSSKLSLASPLPQSSLPPEPLSSSYSLVASETSNETAYNANSNKVLKNSDKNDRSPLDSIINETSLLANRTKEVANRIKEVINSISNKVISKRPTETPNSSITTSSAEITTAATTVSNILSNNININNATLENNAYMNSEEIDDKIENNPKDISTHITEPADIATKLLIDLEEEVKVYLTNEEEALSSSLPSSYAGAISNIESEIIDRQANQLQPMLDQMNTLSANLEQVINELLSRRRYVPAAMLRSVHNYARRVRISLERLQNRMNALQAAASSGQGTSTSASSTGGIPGFPGAQFFITIRDRINNINEQIGNLMNRIRTTIVPTTSAPQVSRI